MVNKEPSLRTVVQINGRFIAAGLALAYGWLCWQWASPEWWGLYYVAIVCLVGGGAEMIAIALKIAGIIKRRGEIAVFERQGGAPRADHMADESDLKKQGLIR